MQYTPVDNGDDFKYAVGVLETEEPYKSPIYDPYMPVNESAPKQELSVNWPIGMQKDLGGGEREASGASTVTLDTYGGSQPYNFSLTIWGCKDGDAVYTLAGGEKIRISVFAERKFEILFSSENPSVVHVQLSAWSDQGESQEDA